MIVKELYTIKRNGEKLYRIYSDLNRYITQIETGNIYREAIDVEDAPYTYKETMQIIKKTKNQ